MKFKVGDKVRVVGFEHTASVAFGYYPKFMDHMKGRIYTIRKIICIPKGYGFEENFYTIHEDDLELVEMAMTKKDLKNGMFVEYRNCINKYAMVIGSRLVNEHGFLYISQYDDNLCVNSDGTKKDLKDAWDIVAVYSVPDLNNFSQHELKKYTDSHVPIWKRTEEKTISVEQAMKDLEEKYGCKIKLEK